VSDLFEGVPYVYKRRAELPVVRWNCFKCGAWVLSLEPCPECLADLESKWARLRNLICGGGPGVRKHRAELMRVNHEIMAMQTSTETKT
jgi:hypothetical protein